MSEAAFVRDFNKELISINMIEKPDKSMYSREKAVAEVVAALLSGALRELWIQCHQTQEEATVQASGLLEPA